MASDLAAVLLLANSAEATAAGTVSALGLGWTVTSSPTPPAAVILLIQVPWDRTNTKHVLRLSLLDADGHEVLLGQSAEGTSVPLRSPPSSGWAVPPACPRAARSTR